MQAKASEVCLATNIGNWVVGDCTSYSVLISVHVLEDN